MKRLGVILAFALRKILFVEDFLANSIDIVNFFGTSGFRRLLASRSTLLWFILTLLVEVQILQNILLRLFFGLLAIRWSDI